MAYGNNDTEHENGAPKKADVLIRSTQHIALKQEELSEQTKLAVSRIDEAIELFSKNGQDASYFVKQSGEMFSQLQGENSALKQELLYLAKQSENIYAGLAEKITELSEQAKTREDAMSGLADKINDVAEQTRKSEEVYSNIADRLAELAEQNRRNENAFAALNEKLEHISERTIKSEKAYGELSDKIVVSGNAEPVEVDNSQVLEKLNYLSEQLRRSEGAHSMLADKFEILSMRVEQFGFQSASKPQSAGYPAAAPVAYPVPAQTTVVKEEIDYDKLAEKIAALIPVSEVISPDYIASKVAEQIVIPEVEAAKVKVSVDSGEIARQVASLVNVNAVRNEEIAPASAVLDIDEEALAERIAAKVGSVKATNVAPVTADVNIDSDELADAIALKVGSLKAEDFDILVDDEGCTSISKEIANHLDYEVISNIISDKLRDALDLAAVNAPDYEEMAERISEKITVAGINEDAIADKAAAVLSNYLPELDTDEITDKITGAVIDVVSAIPQPTVDNEVICNTISERLIESQENHDYDIVIDDDGISKITELVTEEIEKQTGTRFDKVEEEIAKLCELLTKPEQTEEQPEEVDETRASQEEQTEEVAVAGINEDDFVKLTDIVAAEIEKGTASRFDKVEEDIAKLCELVSSATEEQDYDEYAEDEEYAEEEDYTALSEVVAAEIEKGVSPVSARLDSLEGNLAKIAEFFEDDETQPEDGEDEYAEDEEYAEEEDYTALSEVVAAEIEKGVTPVSARLDSVEENLAKLTDYLTAERETQEQEEAEASEADEEKQVPDYSELPALVASEVERGLSARLDGVEDNIAKIAEYVENSKQNGEDTRLDQIEEGIAKITEYVENSKQSGEDTRLEQIEQNIAKISEYVTAEDSCVEVSEVLSEQTTEKAPDYSALPLLVASEVERGLSARLDGVEESIAKLTQMFDEVEVQTQDADLGEEYEYEYDYSALSEVVAAEIEKGVSPVSARLDGMEESVREIKQNASVISAKLLADETGDKSDSEGSINELKQSVSSITESVSFITAKLLANELNDNSATAESYEEVPDYTAISNVLATEIERGIAYRLDSVEDNIAKITEIVNGEDTREDSRLEQIEQSIAKLTEYVESGRASGEDTHGDSRLEQIEQSIAKLTEYVESGRASGEDTHGDSRLEQIEQSIARLTEYLENNRESGESSRFGKVEDDVAQIKQMLADGVLVAGAVQEETAAAAEPAVAEQIDEQPEEVDEEEEELVTVSDVVQPEEVEEVEETEEVEEILPVEQPADDDEEDEEDEEFGEEEEDEKDDDDDDFLMNVLDMDAFSDDELMPGELSEFGGGVDFANMMKFKRSFIARIIQSNDEYKQYYGEVKHALLSYKKVNSNVAWGAERFNKGRETIARMKIRGKTLCLYLALDPNEYKTSVYHHLDVSDNKSVAGTPMMVKIKSNLGVRKAIRLIDEMLAARNGEKKEIPERDYAAMYPYETIEELIDDGLVKDVRKK